MKSKFSGYVQPSQEEFTKLWRDATIVVDANVLLGIYGYSQSTSDHLFALLTELTDRLWIPHQFAYEFFRNRPGVILKQAKNCRKVSTSLRKLIEHDFRAKNTHPFVSDEVLQKIEDLCSQLDRAQSDQESMVNSDPYLNRILALFDGKVGEEYDNDTLEDLFRQAETRYASKTPPGFADKDKSEPDCFGDFIAWRQILDYAKNQKVPVLLVTDDAKEDWWHIYDNRTLGPHPKIVSEFVRECGSAFYMYSTSTFTKHAPDYVDVQVEESVLEELKRAMDVLMSEQPPEKSVAKSPSGPKSEPPSKVKLVEPKRLKVDTGGTSTEGNE